MDYKQFASILSTIKNGRFFSITWEKPIELKDGSFAIKTTTQVFRKVRNIGGYEPKGEGFKWATKVADFTYKHNSKDAYYVCLPNARHSVIAHNSKYSLIGMPINLDELSGMAKRKSDLPRHSDKEQLFTLVPIDQIIAVRG